MSSTSVDKATPEQIQAVAKQVEADRTGLAKKIYELQQQEREHQLVLDSFKSLEPSRRCFRMVGGVLVERTVGEVEPAISGNLSNINQQIDGYKQRLEEKNKEAAIIAARMGPAAAAS
eukprot:GDKH01025364.1.p1 GENE.GDKH01025364.1~~GDKH01025364.1.p1  ORF type:complete len:118 (+),score=31.42 GDKH01025364.1:118-471(+)